VDWTALTTNDVSVFNNLNVAGLSAEWGYVNREPNTHEESGEGLAEMLPVWGE
jgi:hypothetical protein